MMLTAATTALLLLSPRPPQGRVPAPPRCVGGGGDAWLFTSIRDDGDSPTLVDFVALQLPFAPPLWPGEVRTFSPSPREYQCLAAAEGAPVCVLTGTDASGLAGRLVCEATVVSLGLSSATIVGVSPVRITKASGERPWLLVRGRRLPIAGAAAADGAGDAARAAAIDLWDQAAASARRCRELRVASTLSNLGGAASAALLAIPEETQRALRRASADAAAADASAGAPQGGAPQPPTTSAGRLLGLDECLEAGVTLRDELRRAAAAAAAAEEEEEGAGLAAPGDAASRDAATLALESFVALRLASAADDEQWAWALSEKASAAARWARANAILTAKRDALRALQGVYAATSGLAGGSDEVDADDGTGAGAK